VGDSAARDGTEGIIAKLWKAIRIEIPIGFQYEAEFHADVKYAEQPVQRASGLVNDEWLNEE